jgi:hypothetical protein
MFKWILLFTTACSNLAWWNGDMVCTKKYVSDGTTHSHVLYSTNKLIHAARTEKIRPKRYRQEKKKNNRRVFTRTYVCMCSADALDDGHEERHYSFIKVLSLSIWRLSNRKSSASSGIQKVISHLDQNHVHSLTIDKNRFLHA